MDSGIIATIKAKGISEQSGVGYFVT